MRYWPPLLTTPSLHLWLVPLLATAVGQCLVAIWAASCRRHWFWRAAAVWAGLWLLVPIRAYEAVWLFALSSSLIAVAIVIARWWDSRMGLAAIAEQPPAARRRLALSDLLLLMLIFGLALTLSLEFASAYQPANLIGWLTSASALAILSVLSYAAVAGPRRQWAAGCLVIALPTCAAMAWAGGDLLRIWEIASIGNSFAEDIVSLSIVGLEFVLVLMVILAANRYRMAAQSPRRRVAWGGVLAVFLTALLLPTAAIYWALLESVPRTTKFRMPTDNHYDEIVAIANQLRALNPTELSIADLRSAAPRSFAPRQVEALYAKLLPLLTLPNAAGYDPERDAVANYSPPFPQLRSLCRALAAESKSARDAGNFDRGADYAEACLRLGAMWRRGGTATEALVGSALESVGLHELASLRAEPSPQRSRALIATLQRTLAEHEDFESLRARELDYENQAYGWQGRLENAAQRLMQLASPWSSIYRTVAARNEAANLLLQTDLSIRLIQLERGRLPSALSELVPGYLPAVPRDPYSAGRELQYRAQDGSYVLYVVGPDGADDGGRFGNRNDLSSQRPGYDFDLDCWTRP